MFIDMAVIILTSPGGAACVLPPLRGSAQMIAVRLPHAHQPPTQRAHSTPPGIPPDVPSRGIVTDVAHARQNRDCEADSEDSAGACMRLLDHVAIPPEFEEAGHRSAARHLAERFGVIAGPGWWRRGQG